MESSLALDVLAGAPLFLSVDLATKVNVHRTAAPIPEFSKLFFQVKAPGVDLFEESNGDAEVIGDLMESDRLLVVHI